MIKLVKLQLFQNTFEVCKTENGDQWTCVYTDSEIEKPEVILEAYVKIGYKDVTKL